MRIELRMTALLPAALAVGIWACGGGGGPAGPTGSSPSQPPTGSFNVSPSAALMAVTVMTFAANGNDPSGGTLSFDWQFGDGQTASGQTVTHVFSSEGAFDVVLTLRSSRGASGTVRQSVTSRSITGTWVDGDPDFELELVQGGSTFAGKVFVQGNYRSDIQNGVLTNPRNIAFYRRWNGKGNYGVYSGQYAGTVDASLNKINADSIPGVSFNLTRK